MIDRINGCIKQLFKVDEVLPMDSLREDYKADDLHIVELAILLESRFDIRIQDEEFEKLETVNDLYEYMEQQTSNGKSSNNSKNA